MSQDSPLLDIQLRTKEFAVKEYSSRANADTKTVILPFNDIRICSAAAKDAISFRRQQTFTLVPRFSP